MTFRALASAALGAVAIVLCIAGDGSARSTVPQAEHLGRTRLTAPSWNDSRGRAVVFVSDGVQGAVKIYAQSNGVLVGLLTRIGPDGIATDVAGDLYVADGDQGGVLFYPPGATSPTATLNMPLSQQPFSIAISSRGDVAVNFRGGVSFFKKGKTEPYNTVSAGSFGNLWYIAYDRDGNLYLDASVSSVSVGEIVGGGSGSSITPLPISNLTSPGGVAVDRSNHLLIMDYNAATLYQYDLPNPSSPSGSVTFPGAQHPLNFALTKSNAAIYVGAANGLGQAGTFWRFGYPSGSGPSQTIVDDGNIQGIAVSPEAKP